MKQPPHFRARTRLFQTEESGAQQGFLSFPESGVRNVPVAMDDVLNMNTVVFFHIPHSTMRAGEEFEADCRVIWEEGFAGVIRPGLTFRIWDGQFIASGEVLHVYRENWTVPGASNILGKLGE